MTDNKNTTDMFNTRRGASHAPAQHPKQDDAIYRDDAIVPYTQRKALRLAEYDYAQAGAYFVTICTQHRECMFGEVVDGIMVLNEVGQVVESEWLQTENIRHDVVLDIFVVMPNHVHLILFIVGADCIRPENHNGTMQSSPTQQHYRVGAHRMRPPNTQNGTMQSSPTKSNVGHVIRGFKSATTKLINQTRQTQGTPVWQRGYYDHIVRNEADLARIREYIANNPAQWALDENNPINPA